MSKKITGVLLCMLMGVTLAACGNSSGTDNPKGQTTDQSEVSSQEKESLSDTQTGITADTEENYSEAEQTSETNNTRILVAYFSRADDNYGVGVVEKGNTEIIAEMIAEETGADTFKIERATPYPADYDACTEEAQQEQRKNARPELKNTLDNLDDYDVVYLGMPVWWGDMPMPVYTFVEGLDWNGKTVYPFTTHAESRLSSIPRTLGNICDGATIGDGFTIAGTDAQNAQDKAKEAVTEWLRSNE